MTTSSPAADTFDAEVLEAVDDWGAQTVAIVVVDADGLVAQRGPVDATLSWASVTKPLTAAAVLVAVKEGVAALDEPARPPGSTIRHLLAHASGLAMDEAVPISPPERTRIYSNAGFDLLGDLVASRVG